MTFRQNYQTCNLSTMKTIIIIFILLLQTIAYDWSQVDAIIYQYYLEGAYPGAVLRIGNSTHTLHQYVVGYFSRQGPYSSAPFLPDTIFDLASLTKVTATLTCFMHLYDTGKVDIDDKVIKYVEEFGKNGKQITTIRNLLLHNSGLPDEHPDPNHSTKEDFMKYIYNYQPDFPVGTQYQYSDMGFVLLTEIIYRISGKTLDQYSKIFFDEIGLVNTTFLPKNETHYRIAPTQYSPARQRLIRGEVHDNTAFAFGGVAGDAGLFSTAADLQTFMQFHLQGGVSKKGVRIFNQSTVSTFWKKEKGLPYDNSRALGWDTVPNGQYPPCGHLFSQNSMGHTGYTGTMMWGDRDRDLIIVFLTNRVHPSDIDITVRKVRSLISDAIVEQFDKKVNIKI